MQLQTATSTTTTMAYPSLPASPTLTNPDMILPYGEYDSTPSPPHHPYRPPSPGDEWRGSNPADMQFSIGPPHIGPVTPTTPIIYGNGTMLSDIGEVTEAESTQGRKLPGPAERRMLKQAQNQPIRSSPTMGYEALMKRTKTGNHQRTVSTESTSTVTSEGQVAEVFRDFDDRVSVDDSNFQGDDEESVADSYSEGVIAQETERLSRKDNPIEVEEDRNSSAALSRRAEQILLNAKKRLNNMEGNLTRARSSLHTTPSGSLSSIHSSSPLSRSTPSPPQNQRLISQLGPPPSKHRQLHTPSDSPLRSPGHSRVYSENSISATKRATAFPVRASSAAARYIGKSGTDGGQQSPALSQSTESIREEAENTGRHGFSSPLSRTSPPRINALEALSEDGASPGFEADKASIRSSLDEGSFTPSGEHRLTRSASNMQMRDLRDQMHDLKGRLSVLRDRARDDTMKRRSLQSLRTPSPFTAAEQWYAAAKEYGDGGLSADAGAASPPWKPDTEESKEIVIDEKPNLDGPKVAKLTTDDSGSDVTSIYEDVAEGNHSSDNTNSDETKFEDEEDPEEIEEKKEQQDDKEEDDYNDEIVNRDEADDYESDSSLYHDSLSTPISHEDREDAFDYEHFFLHSAMGTLSQQRRGSFSSEDSVETTRGPIVESKDASKRPSLTHLRSDSSASVSTVATFATATEGRRSIDDRRDDFAVQEVEAAALRSTTPLTAKRTTLGGSPIGNGTQTSNDRQLTPEETSRPSSVIRDRKERNGITAVNRPSVASFDSVDSTGSTRSFPLVNKPKIGQAITTSEKRELEPSILSDSMTLIDRQSSDNGERLQSSPVSMLAKDDQILVERLVASLGKCVLGLQESGRGSYDGRIWRRRLDAARRVLEGQEGAV